eukprot:CAMPEP_0119428504 /NCGR_PEP_ID=MMETSP1335-20130426/40599_1 /TAXON_ID=259385 /ORGANISM="Chrysoculter rhomboideus, Strain RCC1486" /LENGTH=75 /DNA_ID=CAMNT_0007454195 /DNA_START=93 /DNA_END=316 /DNA_ORIENTATION=-
MCDPPCPGGLVACRTHRTHFLAPKNDGSNEVYDMAAASASSARLRRKPPPALLRSTLRRLNWTAGASSSGAAPAG